MPNWAATVLFKLTTELLFGRERIGLGGQLSDSVIKAVRGRDAYNSKHRGAAVPGMENDHWIQWLIG